MNLYLDGKKTYIAAAGLFLLGVYDFLNGDSMAGLQKITEAAGLAGLRHGVSTTIKNGSLRK